MSAKLEKMARAVVEDLAQQQLANRTPRGVVAEGAMITVDGGFDLTSALRAALLAIREPDDVMVAAAEGLEPQPGYWPDEPGERNTPAQHFTAMIDAILGDEKP